MNKFIIFLFAILAFSACKKNANNQIEAADQAVVENLPQDTFSMPETPTFTDKAAQDYVTAYDAFLIEYKQAVISDDKIKLQELAGKMVELSSQGTAALKNLEGEEARKLSEYMGTRASEFTRISSKAYNNNTN